MKRIFICNAKMILQRLLALELFPELLMLIITDLIMAPMQSGLAAFKAIGLQLRSLRIFTVEESVLLAEPLLVQVVLARVIYLLTRIC